MIEYLEDAIEIDPAEEFPQEVQDSGRYVHKTGDALFDQWQEKAAKGEDIDFGEAFTDPAARAAFEQFKVDSKVRHKAKTSGDVVEMPEDVHDDFTGGGG